MGNVRMTFTAEDAQAVRSFMKLENKSERLKRKQKELSQQATKTGKNGASGMNKWRQSATRMVTTYFGIEKAIDAATDAWQHFQNIRKQAGKEEMKEYEALQELAQVAEDRDDLRRMRKEVQDSVEQGMGRREAAQLQFLIESGDKAETREMYGELSTITESPQRMADAVTTIQNALGRKETGADKAMIEKLLEASRVSKTDIGEIAGGATRAAQSVKDIGTTDEELLAATAVASKSEDSTRRVATRVAGLSEYAQSSDVLPHDEGIMGIVETAQKMEDQGKKVSEIFTERRAKQAYTLLRDNMEFVNKVTEEVTAAGRATSGTDTMFGPQTARKINAMRQEFPEAFSRKRTEAGKKRSRQERYAKDELSFQSIRDKWLQLREQAGHSPTKIGMEDKLLRTTWRHYAEDNEQLLYMLSQRTPDVGKKLSQHFGYKLPETGWAESAARFAIPGSMIEDKIWGPQKAQRVATPQSLLVDEPNTNNEAPGTRLEVEARLKDQRSPQSERKGGGAGVE